MVNANSRIKINSMRINRLLRAQIQALEMTAEALHTEVVQSQVMPFDTGFMQNESTWVDYSNSSKHIGWMNRSKIKYINLHCIFIQNTTFKLMKMLLLVVNGMSLG